MYSLPIEGGTGANSDWASRLPSSDFIMAVLSHLRPILLLSVEAAVRLDLCSWALLIIE